MSFLANRYAIHAIVIVLAFAVTATNIYAREGGDRLDDAMPQNIIGGLTMSEDEVVVVEEASMEASELQQGVSYLGSQALSIHDAEPPVEYFYDGSSTDAEAYVDDESELLLAMPTFNAVRVQPGHEEADVPPTRTQTETYVVQSGDSIGSISRGYGLRTETLLATNSLTARSILRIGQELKIPPVDGLIYKVKSGDTINKIATTYGSDVEKIREFNGLQPGAALAVGAELILPDGRAPAPPPVRKPPARIASNIRNILTKPKPSPEAATSGSGSMVWPAGVRRISQYYGNWRRGTRHTGVDIAGPTGTNIYAADDGVVSVSGWNSGGYGNMVLISHGGGLFTRYGHGSKLLVQAGDTVKKGDVIMLMGSTGNSTGPHLHFEVMVGDPHKRVNPLDYVR